MLIEQFGMFHMFIEVFTIENLHKTFALSISWFTSPTAFMIK